MKRLVTPCLYLLMSATALAGELTLGEMNTAATLENKDVLLHPLFSESSMGLTEKVELKSCLACNLYTANAGVEYSVYQAEDRMFSASTNLATNHASDLSGVDISAHYSAKVGAHWVTMSLGTGAVLHGEFATTTGTPLELTYLVLNGDRAWEFTVGGNPYTTYATGMVIGQGSARWYRAWNYFRLGLGLTVVTGNLNLTSPPPTDDAINAIELPSFIPLPALSMAWRL